MIFVLLFQYSTRAKDIALCREGNIFDFLKLLLIQLLVLGLGSNRNLYTECSWERMKEKERHSKSNPGLLIQHI